MFQNSWFFSPKAIDLSLLLFNIYFAKKNQKHYFLEGGKEGEEGGEQSVRHPSHLFCQYDLFAVGPFCTGLKLLSFLIQAASLLCTTRTVTFTWAISLCMYACVFVACILATWKLIPSLFPKYAQKHFLKQTYKKQPCSITLHNTCMVSNISGHPKQTICWSC